MGWLPMMSFWAGSLVLVLVLVPVPVGHPTPGRYCLVPVLAPDGSVAVDAPPTG